MPKAESQIPIKNNRLFGFHYAVVFWFFCSIGLCEPPNFAFLFVPVVFFLWKTYYIIISMYYSKINVIRSGGLGVICRRKNKADLQ